MNRNKVILKGKKDKLIIHLDSEIEFSELKICLIDKLKEAESFIGSSKTAIEFSNRLLSEDEENILLDLIRTNSSIKISYLFSNHMTEEGLEENSFMKLLSEEGITKFHKGTLRSGHRLDYHGNIVILGDVNPGAVVKAKGNILVLGYLNGTAYAGQDNDSEAFIGALSMNPIQLKIGQFIAANPNAESLEANRIKKTSSLEIAYSKEDRIFIETFDKNTLLKMKKISD